MEAIVAHAWGWHKTHPNGYEQGGKGQLSAPSPYSLKTIVAHAWEWHRTHPNGYEQGGKGQLSAPSP